jgi:tetratricopeptide (TPR) repeat protein
MDGRVAVHSGAEVFRAVWAGERHGPGYSVQGNGLVGAEVLEAMERVYLKTAGSLAERLLAALVAGDRAGGQKTGRESAALLVKTMDGWPVDIDLRVDHSADPLRDLQTLFDIEEARVEMGQARRAANRGDFKQARTLTDKAVTRASLWSRIWLQAAQLAVRIEDRELALRYLQVAFAENPKWIESEIGDGEYAALGRCKSFHQWVTPGQGKEALEAYLKLQAASKVSPSERLEVGRKLMEVGRLVEAREVLERVAKSESGNREAQKLLAEMDEPEK